LKAHSAETNLQVKPFPQSTSSGPGVEGIGGNARAFIGTNQTGGLSIRTMPVFHQLDHPSTQFAKSRHAASGYSAK
jgi:hypothetical protein